jgi:hypothetical protein
MRPVPPFAMTVSAEGPFLAIASEVAGRYAEMAGGTAADAAGVTTALAGTLDQVAAGAGPDATIDLTFRANGHGIEIAVRCGALASVVRHPLLARKR